MQFIIWIRKKNDDRVLIGGEGVLCIFDNKSCKVCKIENESLKGFSCLNVVNSEIILVGNRKGEIYSYDLSSNQFISNKKIGESSERISCLIKTQDNHFISASGYLGYFYY